MVGVPALDGEPSTAAAIDGSSWRNVAGRLAWGAFPHGLRDGQVSVLVGHESAFVHVPGQDPVWRVGGIFSDGARSSSIYPRPH